MSAHTKSVYDSIRRFGLGDDGAAPVAPTRDEDPPPVADSGRAADDAADSETTLEEACERRDDCLSAVGWCDDVAADVERMPARTALATCR